MSTTPLERYLAEQGELTAVQRFSQAHEAGVAATTGTWRDRIPLTGPVAGQQYAFDVDLDTCTGCKACVTACHNLNGLDDGESYRTVGLLKGGTPAQPFQQTVTAACHHCVDPACLAGCPTNAYEKDVFTGIVAHIEGRCLGCGYCTWMCPYEVPRFNAARGVVRKCDMCRDRLAEGQAPACVSACPNGAITITVVDTAAVVRDAARPGQALVPTAPPSAITLPTTTYHSDWGLPDGLTAAGATLGGGGRSHEPLVAMLVLTQAAAGALAVDLATGHRAATTVVALALAVAGLILSVLHLGRPERAWRALAGLRHSWLSREVAALGAFGGLALVAVLTGSRLVEAAAVVAGSAGVACSGMLYVVTRRPSWRASMTGPRFAVSALVSGTAVATAAGAGQATAVLLALALAAKLAWEMAYVWRPLSESVPANRAQLALSTSGRARVALGVGAVVAAGARPSGLLAALVLAAVLAGELLERSHFFTDASWTGMPGPKT
jgi:Fe-S-cluster-containing dehydrogenase component/DMSO reductase anchor subunit